MAGRVLIKGIFRAARDGRVEDFRGIRGQPVLLLSFFTMDTEEELRRLIEVIDGNRVKIEQLHQDIHQLESQLELQAVRTGSGARTAQGDSSEPNSAGPRS